MIERYQKVIALVVTVAFLALLPVYALPVPLAQTLSRDEDAPARAEQTKNFVEKEQQQNYQASSKKLIPVLIGVVVVAALVFLLVILVSKEKYDLIGVWDFHNDFTTGSYAAFDSVWTFTAKDDLYKQFGYYVRNENGAETQGEYTIVDKKEVVFHDAGMTEEYVGRFDSTTTLSGTFVLADGAAGTWTATKR